MLSMEVAEAFHVAFLSSLRDSAGATSFALKGGGNLRLFLRSLRFSEDIDLDVFTNDLRPFSQRVDRAFASPGLVRLLGSLGIKIVKADLKERTAHREKWNIYLLHRDIGDTPARTRVEMSNEHRELAEYVEIGRIPDGFASAYSPLLAPVIGHYTPRGAVIQKVHALEDRRAVQPRDVFDLDHLFRTFPDAKAKGFYPADFLDRAVERVYQMGYEAYLSKVVTFLDPAIAGAYRSMDVWGRMQVRVVENLEDMKP